MEVLGDPPWAFMVSCKILQILAVDLVLVALSVPLTDVRPTHSQLSVPLRGSRQPVIYLSDDDVHLYFCTTMLQKRRRLCDAKSRHFTC